MDSDGRRSLCRILSSAYALEARKEITKEVTVTLISGGRKSNEGGWVGVAEG